MRRSVRFLLITCVAGTFLGGAAAGGLFAFQASLDSDIVRIPDALPGATDSERPAQAPGDGENWLLVGSDTRSESGTTGKEADSKLWRPGEQRTDTIMLVHLSEDHSRVAVVSIPRDSWVPVAGHGKQKINAAFSFGGPALLIKTVEKVTGLRIDHYAAIDFKGFSSATDAIGGVDVDIAETVRDPLSGVTWKAGRQHLDGEKALQFVRQRYNLPGGDFDRIKRQQALLNSIADKVLSAGTLANPIKVNNLLRAITKAVSVDATVDSAVLRSLLLDMADLESIDYLTLPDSGTGMEGSQSVVYLDRRQVRSLITALRADRLSRYLELNGGSNAVDKVL
jgi:LCP family protein required for cell wall assembly